MRKRLKNKVNLKDRPRLVLRTADAFAAYAYSLNTDKYMELSGYNTAVYGNFLNAY